MNSEMAKNWKPEWNLIHPDIYTLQVRQQFKDFGLWDCKLAVPCNVTKVFTPKKNQV